MDTTLPQTGSQSLAAARAVQARAELARRWLGPMAAFGLIAMLLAGLSRLTIVDLDLFHELSFVREALASRHFPLDDTFAYTPTVHPVVHHEWGTGAVLYAVTVAAGLGATGLMLVKYALSLLVAGGCFACARRRGASKAVAAFLAPLVVPMALCGFSTVRAQLFTLAFLVMLLHLLSRRDRRHSWLALWLVLYVLWFNMHGGFLVGFGLFVVYTAERIVRSWRVHGSLARAVKESRALVLASAAMTVLPVLSPFGTAYYAYLWHAVGMPRPIIAEWQPLWSQQYPEVLLCFGVSLGLVAYAVAARGIGRLPELSLLLAPAWLALEHTRHLPIYAVVWMCLAPAWIAPTRLGGEVEKLWRNQAPILVVFWLVLGLMSLVYAGENRFWRLRIPTSPAEASEGIPIYPAGAVDYLDAHGFSGNLMVPFDAGSYVSWKLHPAVRVSLDSRYEVAYPPQAAEEAVRFFAAADGWQSTLSRYPTDAVLVPWWSALNGLLEASVSGEAGAFHWQCVYRDDAYAIYMPEPRAKQYPVVDRRGEVIAASFP